MPSNINSIPHYTTTPLNTEATEDASDVQSTAPVGFAGRTVTVEPGARRVVPQDSESISEARVGSVPIPHAGLGAAAPVKDPLREANLKVVKELLKGSRQNELDIGVQTVIKSINTLKNSNLTLDKAEEGRLRDKVLAQLSSRPELSDKRCDPKKVAMMMLSTSVKDYVLAKLGR